MREVGLEGTKPTSSLGCREELSEARRPNRDEEDKATTSTTMDLADARLYPRITASHMRAEKVAEGWQDLVLKIGVC